MEFCSLAFAIAFSSHIRLNGDYNEIHPAMKCDRDNNGIIAGLYLNSESRVSTYAGYKLSSIETPLWIEFGAVTGYTTKDILPYVRVGFDMGKGSLFIAPGAEVYNDSVKVGAVIGYEFKF